MSLPNLTAADLIRVLTRCHRDLPVAGPRPLHAAGEGFLTEAVEEVAGPGHTLLEPGRRYLKLVFRGESGRAPVLHYYGGKAMDVTLVLQESTGEVLRVELTCTKDVGERILGRVVGEGDLVFARVKRDPATGRLKVVLGDTDARANSQDG